MYERCGVPQNEDILEAIAAMPDAEAAKTQPSSRRWRRKAGPGADAGRAGVRRVAGGRTFPRRS